MDEITLSPGELFKTQTPSVLPKVEHSRRFLSTSRLPSCLFILASAILLFAKRVNAQQLAVSATAAWSSQIIAFWGALIIGAHSSNHHEVTNAITSIAVNLSIFNRRRRISALLSRNDWLLCSGMENGITRTDIVLICWHTLADLGRIALQVSMQIGVVGDDWEVLVCGRKLTSADEKSRAWWMQSPRCEDFCTTKVIETAGNYFPFGTQSISSALNEFQNLGTSADDIAKLLDNGREKRPSRCAYISEVRSELQEQLTIARHFTSCGHSRSDIPFVRLAGQTGVFGSSRKITMKCASRMYATFHLTVAVAVGLMGAASGRGLAVWVMTIRPALRNLGASGVVGNDVFSSLLSFDNTVLEWETEHGSELLAGDTVTYGLRWWHLLSSLTLPIGEIGILCAGWLYGALRVEKLKPEGLVGHGMLWLAGLVGLSLSTRALLGVRQRISGRLVGIYHTHEYTRYIVGGTISISVESILASRTVSTELRLIATILRECHDNSVAILAASGMLRRLSAGTSLQYYLAADVLRFQYSGDSLVGMGDPIKPITTASVYPWIQSSCCILLTAGCACVSVLYAYLPLPA